MKKRFSGILLHITSLPSHHGIGDLGPGAFTFIDFLAEAGQKYWQILPLTPTNPFLGNSPYSSHSAFAGNPILISPTFMLKEEFLLEKEMEKPHGFHPERVDYDAVTEYKTKLLRQAFVRSFDAVSKSKEYKHFLEEEKSWLDDFALFMALKDEFKGKVWDRWPEDIRDRQKKAMDAYRKELDEKIRYEKFVQFIFHKQWKALRSYAHSRGVLFVGDMPIYVNYDSVDVWQHPHLFKLDDDKEMIYVAGVPPDYFSEDGQLWGNPVYEWKIHLLKKFEWWKERFRHNFRQVDILRVDHFRGFVGYWQVKNGEKTARNGQWVPAPADLFFTEMKKTFKDFPIIAEDLGIITDDVKEILKKYNFPGMKVFLFSFGGNPDENPYTMQNHIENCFLYTGTHDNNTARGWLQQDASPEEKANLELALGRKVSVDEVAPELVKLCMSSVANVVIFPLQDILGLGAEARMNRPSTNQDNWEWRVAPGQLNPETAQHLHDLTKQSGR